MNELERKKKISKRVGRSEWSREVINTGGTINENELHGVDSN